MFEVWAHRRDRDLNCVIAQLVEQVAVNHRVAGSSPAHAVLLPKWWNWHTQQT